MDEGHEDDVQFIEPREDTAESLESPEQALDFVSALVHGAIVFPRGEPVGLGRHNRDESEIQRQLTGLIALVGFIHEQMKRFGLWPHAGDQVAPWRRVVGVAWRERESYGRSGIRGNQMNLGGPAAAGFADGLRAVFLALPCRRDELSRSCCPALRPRS